MFTLYRQSYAGDEPMNESLFELPKECTLATAIFWLGAEVSKYEDQKSRHVVDYWSLMLEWEADGIIETVAILSSTDVYYD